MTTNSLIFVSWLALAPPETTYEKSLEDLAVATQSIAEVSRADAITKIERALAAVMLHPESLLHDSTAADKIARARLALVWAYLAEGNTQVATAMMDDTIRGSRGRDLPLAGLGPDVRKFSQVRRQQLEAAGTGTIEVDCDDCQVLVDEFAADNPTAPLLLGRHRVWLFDPGGKLPPKFFDVALASGGEVATLVFRAPNEEIAAGSSSEETSIDSEKGIDSETSPVEAETTGLKPAMTVRRKETDSIRPFKPEIPRWVKILGMGLGVGVAVTGGVLLSLEGKCKNGDTPTAENVDSGCESVWTNKVPNYTLLGLGAGLFMGAGVWLTVDEVRVGRARHANVMAAWTIRF